MVYFLCHHKSVVDDDAHSSNLYCVGVVIVSVNASKTSARAHGSQKKTCWFLFCIYINANTVNIQLNGNFNCVWKNIFTIIYSPLRACLYIYIYI